MFEVDVAGYLARLGVRDACHPSPHGLRMLHRAHVERVAYQTVDIHLGRLTSIDPRASADRIVRLGRGGYCLVLNGAFGALLSDLGYRVRRHRGGVLIRPDLPVPGAHGNHHALTVHDLPDEDNPGGEWLVDVGLGDGLHEPVPLVAGVYRQGPFTYDLRPSPAIPGGWRFLHDPAGAFFAMDFRPEPAVPADFAARHIALSTAPDSRFVRVFSAHRRDATGVDALRGCVLSRIGAGAGLTELRHREEWYEALADVFGIGLGDLSAADRERLWRRVRTAHGAWRERRSPEDVCKPTIRTGLIA
jgi:N-hydroxyarylamine O-acetyltransferase